MISNERLEELLIEDDLHNFPPSREEVNGMAKELLTLRKARADGIDVAAGVYTMLGISGYSPTSTGCAQQKLMSKAGKVIYQAKDEGIDFDWYAKWMD